MMRKRKQPAKTIPDKHAKPTCAECGCTLWVVDCEASYSVVRGGRVMAELITEPYYCPVCNVGVSESEIMP